MAQGLLKGLEHLRPERHVLGHLPIGRAVERAQELRPIGDASNLRCAPDDNVAETGYSGLERSRNTQAAAGEVPLLLPLSKRLAHGPMRAKRAA